MQRRAQRLAAAGIFLSSFLLAQPLYLRGLNLLDEGALLHVADRLARGETLYADVATSVTPGAYYLVAFLFRAFGPAVEVGRYLQMALLGAAAALLYLIACRLLRPGHRLPVVAVFVSISLYTYRLPNYSPLAMVFVLLAFHLLLRFLDRGRTEPLLLCGAAVSLAFLTKQNYGALAFLALLVPLVVGPPGARRRRSLRAVALYSAGFALPVALVALFFAYHSALGEMFFYTVESPLRETAGAFYKPYPLLDPRQPLAFRRDLAHFTPFPHAVALGGGKDWRFLLSVLTGAVFLAVPAIVGAAAVHLGLRARARELRGADLALVSLAAFMFLGAFPRSDFHHLCLVLPPVLLSAGILYERLGERLRDRRWLSVASGSVLGSFCLASLLGAYAPVLFRFPEAMETSLGLERARRIRVSSEAAGSLRGVVGYLQDKVPPGEPLLVIPKDPLLYFLARRENPSPYPLILPGSFDAGVFGGFLPAVEYVVYRDIAFDRQRFVTLFPGLAARLAQGFAPDEGFPAAPAAPGADPFVVLERREGGRRPAGQHLLQRWERADRSLLDRQEGARRLAPGPRLRMVPHLFKPSLRLRSPSGSRKLAITYKVVLPEGPRLRFSTMLRRRGGARAAGGAVLEAFLYDADGELLHRLWVRGLDPAGDGAGGWQPAEIDLSAFSRRRVLLSFVVSRHPAPGRFGTEVLLGDPRLLGSDPGDVPEVEPLAHLPSRLASELGRFHEVGAFEPGPEAPPTPPRSILTPPTPGGRKALPYDPARRLTPPTPGGRKALPYDPAHPGRAQGPPLVETIVTRMRGQ